MAVQIRVSSEVDDGELSALHHRAFGNPGQVIIPWSVRLKRHSLLWVTAEHAGALVGFVNVIGDGGRHAFLLDTVVAPDRQGEGIGRHLVATAAAESRALGCEWLHVDFADDLTDFYLRTCGFRRTSAGLIALD